jgi:hypothetical protein
MTLARVLGVCALFALLAAPVDADAQGRGRGGSKNKGSGGGPAFCRSGAGHPVHGRQWCRDKGWDSSNRSIWGSRRDDGRIIVLDPRDRDDDRDDRDRDRDDDNRRAEPRIRWPF